MTVKDLVLLLQQMPQDAVVIRGDSEYGAFGIDTVEFADEFDKISAREDKYSIVVMVN